MDCILWCNVFTEIASCRIVDYPLVCNVVLCADGHVDYIVWYHPYILYGGGTQLEPSKLKVIIMEYLASFKPVIVNLDFLKTVNNYINIIYLGTVCILCLIHPDTYIVP